MFLLSMDSLEWAEVIHIYGNGGAIGRAEHHTIHHEESDFIILGGIDENYQLSNKIAFLTFDKHKILNSTK